MELNIKFSNGLQGAITRKSINQPDRSTFDTVDVYVYRASSASGDNTFDSRSESRGDSCPIGHVDTNIDG